MDDSDVAPARLRRLTGVLRWTLRVLHLGIPLAGTLYVLDVQSYLGISLYAEQYMGLFLALTLGSIFLSIPARKGRGGNKVPWYDMALCATALVVGLYLAILYPRLIMEVAYPTTGMYVLGLAAILVSLEATRRTVGWSLVIVAVIFVLYAHFNYLVPEPFYAAGTPWGKLGISLYVDSEGILGMPTLVISTMVFAFVVFGQVLFVTGGGQFLTDFAMASMGQFRGGSAKVAILASSLFGMISGSAVANVATVGVVTIPMMRKAGYRSEVAAGVEAVASTGGQLAPPVMGIAAFLMAEMLSIPYYQVALAAIVPALLYYISLFTQVDLEAARHGLSGLPKEQRPSLAKVARIGWIFLVPLVVVIYTLFFLNYEAGKCGIAGAATALVMSMFRRETRPSLRRFVEILESTGAAMVDLGAIGATVGLVIGAIAISGVGFTFSNLIVSIGENSLALLLILTAVTGIILGMGLPTGAVYILLAVLVGSALEKLGIQPLAAHMFIFYFGMMSMITPPVCLAVYTAASIAGANHFMTALHAMRLGAVAFIIPFIFVYSPALLLKGSPVTITLAVITASAGAVILGIAFTGYLFRNLGWFTRVLLTASAVALLIPPGGAIPYSWEVNIIGALIVAAVIGWEWRYRGKVTKPAPNAA